MAENPAVLRISVLASGAVLLDGSPITLTDLEPALRNAAAQNAVVWYYREAASTDGSPGAIQVLQLIVKNKLRLSLSSRPDFSDWVDSQGRSHPRTTPSSDDSFAAVRQAAARGQLVIVRPGGDFLLLPKLPDGSMRPEVTTGLASLIPTDRTRNIAVIAAVAPDLSSTPTVTDINSTIPFFGMLMAFSYLGHAVWIFDGNPDTLTGGCRDADVLIVDSALLPSLPSGWQLTVPAVMRNANILIHDRGASKLRIIPTSQNSTGQLNFAH